MINYPSYHNSPIFISSKEGTDFPGLSFKTTRNTYHPLHFHDGVEILYVHQGAILVKAFTKTETVKEGQFLANDPYLVHSVESITADTVVTCINISGDYVNESDGIISSIVQRVEDTKEYRRLKDDILEWIRMAYEPDTATDKMLWQMKKIFPIIQKILSVALLEAKEGSGTMRDAGKNHERITSIISYLFYHHDEPITLDSVSSELYISKYYLSHYIKNAFGYTLKQVLSIIRCQESMIDLLGSRMTIGEIAAKHGFPSVRSYNEAFPRWHGISPAEYRRRHQKETVLYLDFAGEEVGFDEFSNEEERQVRPDQGYGFTVDLPRGNYEVLCVENGKDSVNARLVKLSGKNKNITMDRNSEELILRIRKQ